MIRACAAVGGCSTASTLPWRWISCCRRAVGELLMAIASAGDETIDLAVAEQPAAVLFDHLVEVAAARADLRPFRTVLDHGPVGADLGPIAVKRDRDVSDQMDRTRPVVAGLRPDVARPPGDRGAAGALAEGGVPGAVLGEQCRHVVIAATIEAEAVLRQHLANGVLFLERARHRFPPYRLSPQCSPSPTGLLRFARNDSQKELSLRRA